MQVEISDKEKTALSLLVNLRTLLTRNINKKIIITPIELRNILDEAIKKINSNELRLLDTILMSETPKENNPYWDNVNEQIGRSKITRYPWDKIFGISLTQKILNLRKVGHTGEECYSILLKDQKLKDFLFENKKEKTNILKNLQISISSRYAENQTSEKVNASEEDE